MYIITNNNNTNNDDTGNNNTTNNKQDPWGTPLQLEIGYGRFPKFPLFVWAESLAH